MLSAQQRARAAFARRAWGEAFSSFVATAESTSLDAGDQERLAICAYLIGEDAVCADAWEAAYRAALDGGDPAEAAHSAFWLALCLMLRGQMAPASGWLTRSERLVADSGLDCAVSGYLLIPPLLGSLDEGDAGAAADLAVQAAEIGSRFDDADLLAFATLGHGQALIASGDSARGTARLDEVMVSVTAGEVGPITSGIVYCAVILECMHLFDLRRAVEWTDALTAWCDEQPDLVPYRGQCLVHRSQLEQAAGRWHDAIATAATACQRLSDPPHPALGLAHYQEAELHRLTGRFDSADDHYQHASRSGYDPMPGIALLQLARGDPSAAAAAIRRALHEPAPAQRPALLAAAVDVFRASGDVAATRAAADELAAMVTPTSPGTLRALAAQAAGAALIAEGDAPAALVELRAAATQWQSSGVPYEAARAAVLLGLACTALGDRTAAALELDNARETFTSLGARPDLERLTTLSDGLLEGGMQRGGLTEPRSLTGRELEVLALVAAGMTNRGIGQRLDISQHTVGRHLENIFTKLGVTTRAAATAYAYEHGLL